MRTTNMGHDPSMEQYATPPRKRRRVWPWVLIGLALLVLCGGVIGMVASAANGPDDAVATSPAIDPGMGNTGAGDKTTPTTRAATPKAVTVKEGTWSVGKEMPLGTYTAIVPDKGFGMCAWFIRTGTNPEDVRDFGQGEVGARMRVTVKRGDVEFQTQGCGTWTKAK